MGTAQQAKLPLLRIWMWRFGDLGRPSHQPPPDRACAACVFESRAAGALWDTL